MADHHAPTDGVADRSRLETGLRLPLGSRRGSDERLLWSRDVRFVLMYALGFWYLVTPIIYPTSYIPEKYRPIAEFNPLSAPVEFVKYGLLDTSPPSGASVVVSLSVLVVLLVGGYLSFQRREARAQELI